VVRFHVRACDITKNSFTEFFVYFEALFMRATSRDFFLSAAPFLMVFPFAALSIALYAEGIIAIASLGFFVASNFLMPEITSSIDFFRLRLNTRFLREFRSAFFADEVIAIFSSLATALSSRAKAQSE
jgi:hypothetical protein